MPMAIAELAPALKSQSLADSIASHIAAATSVKKLGGYGDRIDQLVSEDKITGDEWSALTDAIAARHAELEPAKEVADA
jgi:uncharacterized protein YutE (UPF0331/DUF86 family)